MQQQVKCHWIPIFILLAAAGAGWTGCAARRIVVVAVSVIDGTTHKPVPGVAVSGRNCRALTDTNGLALLKPNLHQYSTGFSVECYRGEYQITTGAGLNGELRQQLLQRPRNTIPSIPDMVVNIYTTGEVKRIRLRQEQDRKVDQNQLEYLYSQTPNVWPECDELHPSWAKGATAGMLIHKRWSNATTTFLGGAEDPKAIKKVVITHMDHPGSKVYEIRWLSERVVMVQSGWVMSPLAAETYLYVLEKTEQRWRVLVYYLTSIS